MARRMKWKDAAPLLNLSPNALYSMIVQGTVPALRIGAPGRHGRIIVDLDLCEEAIKKRMLENVHKSEPEQPYTPMRRVK